MLSRTFKFISSRKQNASLLSIFYITRCKTNIQLSPWRCHVVFLFKMPAACEQTTTQRVESWRLNEHSGTRGDERGDYQAPELASCHWSWVGTTTSRLSFPFLSLALLSWSSSLKSRDSKCFLAQALSEVRRAGRAFNIRNAQNKAKRSALIVSNAADWKKYGVAHLLCCVKNRWNGNTLLQLTSKVHYLPEWVWKRRCESTLLPLMLQIER